jgi:murein tripeptide amidase MpaA
MSTVQIASVHNCLAMTLEMPFKDTSATANEKFGWSPQRSKQLAHSCLQSLHKYLLSDLL